MQEEMKLLDSYTSFAYVYDTFMDQEPYDRWADRVCAFLDEFGLPRTADISARDTGKPLAGKAGSQDSSEDLFAEERNIVVDLGCGTGKLTEILAGRGYDMIGIDLSEDMLAIAQERKIKNGSSTLYSLQDMRDFELYGAAGSMVSVGDSINYLLEEKDLEDMFRCVARSLLPGGVFVFDFKTIHLYRDIIGDRTIAEDRGDCAFIWDNYYDPETCINEYDLTIFVSKEGLEVFPDDYPYPYDDPWKKEGALFHRFRETHFQRGYEPDQLRRAAESAGLTWITAQDAETGEEITETTERAMAVVRKSAQM